jgi:hypothetical protein
MHTFESSVCVVDAMHSAVSVSLLQQLSRPAVGEEATTCCMDLQYGSHLTETTIGVLYGLTTEFKAAGPLPFSWTSN